MISPFKWNKWLSAAAIAVACGSVLLAYTTSWVANSFPGGSSPQGWVQAGISDMFVRPDGTVYTNSVWDESGHEGGIYKDGKVFGYLRDMHWYGGFAITGNATHIFVAVDDQRTTGAKHRIRKYNYDGTRTPLEDVTINAETDAQKWIPGIAASAHEVYVADRTNDAILVYDANTLRLLRQFPFTAPGRVAVDPSGALWIVRTTTNEIIKLSPKDGSGSGIAITDVARPTALAIDGRGRLMVGDSGPNQQVYTYDSRAKRLATFGSKGGFLSGTPGQIAPLKLISPTGIGTDEAGNFYVASSLGGAVIRKLKADGSLAWQLTGLVFVDSAVPDEATNGADVYTKASHFKMDYTKGPGREWSWYATTVDTLHYPHDPRLMIPMINLQQTVLAIRTVAGRKFLFLTDQYSFALYIYRFEGEIATPSGLICPVANPFFAPEVKAPAKSRFIWRDVNGDGDFEAEEFLDVDSSAHDAVHGWDVDSAGNVWQVSELADGVRQFPLQGIDSRGNPIYTRASSRSYGVPAPFTMLERVKYVKGTSDLWLGGYTKDRPQRKEADFSLVGTEFVRYGKFPKSRKPSTRIPLPYDVERNRYVKAIDVAGDRVVASVLRTSPNENSYVFDGKSGKLLETLLPGAEAGASSGWIDATHAVRAFHRSRGEYDYFIEEDLFEKVLLYRENRSLTVAAR